MVQVLNGKSPKVLGSIRIEGRDLMNNCVMMGKGSLRTARHNMLRKISKDIKFLVHLQRNVMDICLRNMDQYELEHSVVLVQGRLGLGHLLPPSPGIHR